MNRPILLPANTVMRYAVAAGDPSVEYIDGMREHWIKLPAENDVLNVPFLVDATTRQPVPVRVIALQYRLSMDPPTVVIVVGRHH
jgi:hypothetical protein